MIATEYRPMVDKLIHLTQNKQLNWETTSDANKFLITLGLNSVVVEQFASYPDDVSVVAIELLNGLGEKIDGIYISEPDDDYNRMFELYGMARRNALKIEQTISDIMNVLNSKDS